MTQWIRHYWEALRTSYWFVPTVITIGVALLALLLVEIDEAVKDHWLVNDGWLYTGSAEGARQLLATVAGSMITVAGVVFSVTIVALSLASSQFGPRLLRNFMRDRGNQLVLGTFIATFAYCLLVLRTVRGMDGGEFIPHLAVTGAVLLALTSVGVLIYFIHHTAVSVQAPVIVANVGRELRESIDMLFPETIGEAASGAEPMLVDGELPADFEQQAMRIPAPCNGYVQVLNDEKIMKVACKRQLLLKVVHRPGHFVVAGRALALVWPAQEQEVCAELQAAFAIGPQQTPTQDVEYAVNQLVEVAVRALSPGINDPFTAIACIDQLGAALAKLAGRKIPSPYRRDDKKRLRVIAHPVTFPDVVDTAFRQIRQYGRSSPAVVIRMLETIGNLIPEVRRHEDRAALIRQASFIRECADSFEQEADRQDADKRYEQIREIAPDRA